MYLPSGAVRKGQEIYLKYPFLPPIGSTVYVLHVMSARRGEENDVAANTAFRSSSLALRANQVIDVGSYSNVYLPYSSSTTHITSINPVICLWFICSSALRAHTVHKTLEPRPGARPSVPRYSGTCTCKLQCTMVLEYSQYHGILLPSSSVRTYVYSSSYIAILQYFALLLLCDLVLSSTK